MSNDLTTLEHWAGELLAKLQPSERRAITRAVAQDLRRSQQQRITAQQNADGGPYDPRKARKNFKGKKGRIKGKKAAMFVKLKTATHLKVRSDQNQLTVGFFGQVARIARVHQFGLTDRVSQNGPLHRYAARELLSLSSQERDRIRGSVLQLISHTK